MGVFLILLLTTQVLYSNAKNAATRQANFLLRLAHYHITMRPSKNRYGNRYELISCATLEN